MNPYAERALLQACAVALPFRADPSILITALRAELRETDLGLGDRWSSRWRCRPETAGAVSRCPAQVGVDRLGRSLLRRRDQFSDWVLNGQDPRTPGEMGLTDMIAAIDEAIRTSQTVRIAR